MYKSQNDEVRAECPKLCHTNLFFLQINADSSDIGHRGLTPEFLTFKLNSNWTILLLF